MRHSQPPPPPVGLLFTPAAFAEREFPPLRLDHGGHDLLDIEERLSSNRASSAAGSYSLGAVYPPRLAKAPLLTPLQFAFNGHAFGEGEAPPHFC